MKNRGLRIVLDAMSLIMVVSVIIMELLGGGGYRANEEAMQAMEDTKHVVVKETLSYIAFEPTGYYDKGMIFYPGAKIEEEAYAPLLHSIAEEGILCVVVKEPLRLALLGINKADEVRDDYTNVADWYIGGHSLGAYAAGQYVKKNASNLNGYIILGGYSTADISQSNLEVLSLFGDQDGIMNMDKYESCKQNLPTDTIFVEIQGGNHAYFGSYGEQNGDNVATISPQDQQETVLQIIAAFLR